MSAPLLRNARSSSLVIKSPAKVNLRLEVLGRRPDGYHDIRSIMVPISLSDALHIALTNDKRVQVSCNQADLPVDDRNLAYRAGLLILQATGKREGVQIRIRKRIPTGAGLGGGSSNAASTLLGLNRLLEARLTRGDLIEMAVKLGADVPFFIVGRPALATGIGERLEPLAGLPRFWLVLVYPGISVSSRWAYERLNLWLTNSLDHINMPPFSWDISNLRRFLRNDLETGVIEKYPILRWIKRRLLDLGAAACLMSGSGSAVYGVFSAREGARQVCEQLKKEFRGRDWEVFLTRSVGS
jgi:4-diphosphocytidyl-2-C-methyl-D-erythritol kinase